MFLCVLLPWQFLLRTHEFRYISRKFRKAAIFSPLCLLIFCPPWQPRSALCLSNSCFSAHQLVRLHYKYYEHKLDDMICQEWHCLPCKRWQLLKRVNRKIDWRLVGIVAAQTWTYFYREDNGVLTNITVSTCSCYFLDKGVEFILPQVVILGWELDDFGKVSALIQWMS